MKKSVMKTAARLSALCLLLPCFLTDSLAEEPVNRNGYVTAINGLLLRDRPSKDGRMLALMPFKAEIKVVKKLGIGEMEGYFADWYEVRYAGKEGFAFGLFISFNKPPAVKAASLERCNSIREQALSGRPRQNSEAMLGMQLDAVCKILGDPQSFGNGEWGGYFSYEGFHVGFNGYLDGENSESIKRARNKKLTVSSFLIPCASLNINLSELLAAWGKPEKYQYNMQSGVWNVVYRPGKNYVVFYFDDMNSPAKAYEIFMGR